MTVSNQPRVVKVLAALLVSMTTGAVILMALGNNPPSAGPFCLSSYYRLDPIEEAITPSACESPNRWDCVEIFYSGTTAGSIEQLARLRGLGGPGDLNCHFVLCNGQGGGNGQIQATERWRRQWPLTPGQDWRGAPGTIRVCIVGDAKTAWPTDYQVKRLELLLESLARKFQLSPKAIYYPRDCQ